MKLKKIISNLKIIYNSCYYFTIIGDCARLNMEIEHNPKDLFLKHSFNRN